MYFDKYSQELLDRNCSIIRYYYL